MSGEGPQCRACGHQNEPGAKFCSSCGTALGADPRTDTLAHEAVEVADEFGPDRSQFSASQGLLIVTRGPNLGARYALDADRITVGRHPDSEIFLDDITVSRNHAELVHTSSHYTLRDAGSLNGTYLNGVRIDEADLDDGDELQIGKFKLAFFHGTKH